MAIQRRGLVRGSWGFVQETTQLRENVVTAIGQPVALLLIRSSFVAPRVDSR